MGDRNYDDYYRKPIFSPATRAAAKLIDKVYEFSGVGGNLHCVLDDGNVEDGDLAYALAQIKKGDWRYSHEMYETELACHAALASLTFEERVSAIRIHELALNPDPLNAIYNP